MTPTSDQAGELLRERGLRSTPQRRAILAVFGGGRSEHLSADEVYASAAQSLPDLSRGTVYATLAEFSETGLLSAFGASEPVRYETNTGRHSHFRCHLCLRLFDLTSGLQEPGAITAPGFTVERVETRAEGVCCDCNEYDAGLKAGASAISRSGPSGESRQAAGTAVAGVDSPLGTLLLGASPDGLTRLAFEGHGDFGELGARAASRRGSRATRRHLAEVIVNLDRYFDGASARLEWTVDWAHFNPAGARALLATESIPYAGRCSCTDVAVELPARDLGWIMGANPIPIVAPCHRVIRGSEVPTTFVGGLERRRWLEHHERTNGDAPSG